MATAMVRKQVYLPQKQNRKLKAIAELRGCSEAEVIRDALDRLPDPDVSVVERLRAAGLLATIPPNEDTPTAEELRALEAEHEAWLATLTEPLGLAEAVLAEREEADF
jgi:hypothetical protein